MNLLDVKPEVIKDMKEKIEEMNNMSEWSDSKKRQYKIEQAISSIAYQVNINGEMFSYIYHLWCRETSLNQKDREYVKEQAIKLINKAV